MMTLPRERAAIFHAVGCVDGTVLFRRAALPFRDFKLVFAVAGRCDVTLFDAIADTRPRLAGCNRCRRDQQRASEDADRQGDAGQGWGQDGNVMVRLISNQ
jgi:hypothetical protein